jgi:hypothetical protein
MAWNVSDSPEQGGMDVVAGEVAPGAAPPSSPPATSDDIPLEMELTAEDERHVGLLRMYRARMHDLSDPRFEALLTALRNRQSVRSIAREVVEEGLCAYLKPKTVVIYVTKIREALGLRGYVEQQEAIEALDTEEDADEPVEGRPAFKKLQWLSRLQSARVRKALKMEGMMGGLIIPTATTEIKLMSDLIDKELEVALKTGEMKQVPTEVKIEPPPGIENPAQAYRVILAYQKLMRMGDQILEKAEAIKDAE